MKFIGKPIHLIGILLLTIFVGAAAGLYFDVPGRLQSAAPKGSGGQPYTRPMHPEVLSAESGSCLKCRMALVSASKARSGHDECVDTEERHPGCCADKNAVQPTAEFRLPPGHPPLPDWTTDAPPGSGTVSSNIPAHSAH